MSNKIENHEVDIVIAALQPDLTAFLEAWRHMIYKFHLIVVKDPKLEKDLIIPQGFDHRVYTKADIAQVVGSTSIDFSGHSCRYFGYLISRKKYIISIDDDCVPARDASGNVVDAIAQHLINLKTPATPFFFNTLYDPYRPGADFVRGYPFSMREGVECVLSCGLWLNMADYDAPTQAVKPNLRNNRYVDAVMTVPIKAMVPVSGVNIGFNREILGPAMFPGFRLVGEGKRRRETMEDIWNGMCAKAICDHLGFGVKTGLPYVWRADSVGGGSIDSLKRDWEEVKHMEEIAPFFQSLKLPSTVGSTEDGVVKIAGLVRDQLVSAGAVFEKAANAMEEWIRLWKAVASSGA